MSLRHDGDPLWDHDQECSVTHPCAMHQEEEDARRFAEQDEEEKDRAIRQLELMGLVAVIRAPRLLDVLLHEEG